MFNAKPTGSQAKKSTAGSLVVMSVMRHSASRFNTTPHTMVHPPSSSSSLLCLGPECQCGSPRHVVVLRARSGFVVFAHHFRAGIIRTTIQIITPHFCRSGQMAIKAQSLLGNCPGQRREYTHHHALPLWCDARTPFAKGFQNPQNTKKNQKSAQNH